MDKANLVPNGGIPRFPRWADTANETHVGSE